MENSILIQQINSLAAIQLPGQIDMEELHCKLSDHVNQLIAIDFQGLLFLLYKIDVDERKLKIHLSANATNDAGNIIATLIIERVIQREQSRKQFTNKPAADDQEEKW
jgi:hypothetical protein